MRLSCCLYVFSHFSSHYDDFCGKAIYCSKECLEYHGKIFHWAECGLLNLLQDDDIGQLALMVYRILVRAGLQTLLQVSNGDINEITKSAIYDTDDYKPVYLQGDHKCQFGKNLYKVRVLHNYQI